MDLRQCILEAQSHSGLSKNSFLIKTAMNIMEQYIPYDWNKDDFVNLVMQLTHENYMKTKNWKSYDW